MSDIMLEHSAHRLAADLAEARAAQVEAVETARLAESKAAVETKRVAAQEAELLMLREKVARAKRLAADGHDGESSSQRHIDAMTKAHESLSAQNDALSAHSATLEEELARFRAMEFELRTASAERRSEVMLHKRAEQGARAQGAAHAASLGAELQSAKEEIAELRADGWKSTRTQREWTARLEILNQENRRLVKQVADMTAVRDLAAAEVVDLRAEMSVTREQMAALRKRVSQQNDQLERLRLQLYSERKALLRERTAKKSKWRSTTPKKRPVTAPPTPAPAARVSEKRAAATPPEPPASAPGTRKSGREMAIASAYKVTAAAAAAPTAVPASRVLHEDTATEGTAVVAASTRRDAERQGLLPPNSPPASPPRAAPPPPEAAPSLMATLSPGRTAGVAAPGQLRTTFGRAPRPWNAEEAPPPPPPPSYVMAGSTAPLASGPSAPRRALGESEVPRRAPPFSSSSQLPAVPPASPPPPPPPPEAVAAAKWAAPGGDAELGGAIAKIRELLRDGAGIDLPPNIFDGVVDA